MQFLSTFLFLLLGVLASQCLTVCAHPFDGHIRSHSHRHIHSKDGCTATPTQIEGPYWVDGQPVRADIREGQPGVALYLDIILLNQSSTSVCQPLVGAAVDIWHTNATGYYAHFTGYDPNEPVGPGPQTAGDAVRVDSESLTGSVTTTQPAPPGPPGPPGPAVQTDNLTFMRGVQLTDKQGKVNFVTIYPGWYSGRCIHIHVEVHLEGSIIDSNFVSGGSDAYIGQLFFDDSWTAKIASIAPYSNHTEISWLPNAEDFIYNAANQLELTQVNPDDLSEGFRSTFVLNVDTTTQQIKQMAINRDQPYFRSYAYRH